MSQSDELRKTPAAKETSFTPRTEFDGVSGFVQTGPLVEQPTEYKGLLEQFGYDPRKVEVVGHPKVSRWQQVTRDGVESWLSAYKFAIRAKSGSGTVAEDLYRHIENATVVKRISADAGNVFCVQIGDVHFGKGKAQGGGVEDIVDQYLLSLSNAVEEAGSVNRMSKIVLSFVGDMIEGQVSQNGKNLAGSDMTVAEQMRVARRMMLKTIDEFRKFRLPIQVHAIGGNHDEMTRLQEMPAGNSFATEIAISLSDALKLNPSAYGDVTIMVPPSDQSHMTVDVGGGTTMCLVHGHLIKGGKPGIEKWWANASLHRKPAGGAHVLIGGHHHTPWVEHVSDKRTIIFSPAMEIQSTWYSESTGGSVPARGMMTYVANDGRISRISVV